LQGLDRTGFLVIKTQAGGNDAAYRSDILTFLAGGYFPNRSGADTATPFTDRSVANAAHVTIGLASSPADALLLHRTLLFPGPASGGRITPAGQPLAVNAGINSGASATGIDGAAAITTSRYSNAAITAAEVMKGIRGGASPLDLAYRFQAADSVYDGTGSNPFVNGYFRMTPILMRGVTSFRVDWTNGQVDALGQLAWYGGPYRKANDTTVEGTNGEAIFSYNNQAKWPKALRITMHVANDRIGGRDFVQVVNLAQ
jgi:hypothetical protein